MNLRRLRGKRGKDHERVGGRKMKGKWHNYFLMKNFQILRELNRIKKTIHNEEYKNRK